MPKISRMSEEGYDNWRKAVAVRGIKCRRCGNTHTSEIDGKEIGGMPGLTYKYCTACGNAEAKTKKPRKFNM